MSKRIRNNINDISTDELVIRVNKYKEYNNNSYNRIKPRKVVNDVIFNSLNSGKFIVIDTYPNKENRKRFTIEFIDSGTIFKNKRIAEIKNGQIKDPLAKTVYCVGCLGLKLKQIKKEDIELYHATYNRWVNMLRRCYMENDNHYHVYGALGVHVSDRWLNFSNYYYDIQKLPNYNRELALSRKLTLDKDYLQQDKEVCNKVYSRKTCCWLTASEQNYLINHAKARRSRMKEYVAVDPDGNKYMGLGLAEFARDHNLQDSECSLALSGKINHVKGYRFRQPTKKESEEIRSRLD